MSERSLYKTLYRNMRGHWEVERIENFISSGTPDVYYTMFNGTMGWIELKYLDKRPKKEETIVRIPHYTQSQRNWIKRHGSKGANIFLFLQIVRQYFLFDWEEAVTSVGYVDQIGLFLLAKKSWRNRINYNEFIKAIS